MLARDPRYVKGHPGHTAVRTANRARAFCGYDYVVSREIQEHCGPVPYMLAFSLGFYHYPVMGLLFPFAAVGAKHVWEQRFAVLRHRWVMVAPAFLALVTRH